MFGLLALWVSLRWHCSVAGVAFDISEPSISFPGRLPDQQRRRRILGVHDNSVCVGTAFAVALWWVRSGGCCCMRRRPIQVSGAFSFSGLADVRIGLGRRGAISPAAFAVVRIKTPQPLASWRR